jgi:heterotetrameric sarcosine oxidase gamma subunit
MVDRVSALVGHNTKAHFGAAGEPGVTFQDMADLVLHQVAAWPETLDEVAKITADCVGAESAPGPCLASVGTDGALLRIEPLKWWVFGGEAPQLAPETGCTLDLSHSRTHVRISGPQAVEFLNRHLSLDLREKSFPVGSVASSAIHHVGVSLWRSEEGYELFIPRGFALTLWEGFVESAGQFGLAIV